MTGLTPAATYSSIYIHSFTSYTHFTFIIIKRYHIFVWTDIHINIKIHMFLYITMNNDVNI